MDQPSSSASEPGAPVAPDESPEGYVEVTARLHRVNTAGAVVISTLLFAAVWGDWRRVAIAVGAQVALIAFNAWVTLCFLEGRDPRVVETLRAVVNIGVGIVIGHLCDWPLPAFLWLPYVALAFDHLGRRVAITILVGICATTDIASLVDGTPWIYPAAFTAFAAICSAISKVRFAIIRDMLARSEQHRRDLELAHAHVREAHERLLDEVRMRERVEVELRQAQKLEAVGRLAAGVAHEINTPVQFVSDNVHFMAEGIHDVLVLVESFRATARRSDRETAAALRAAEEKADLDYLALHLPEAVRGSIEGLGRVADIVRSMRMFAHPDGDGVRAVDLNESIRSTLTIARHEYKLVADVESELGELPPVECRAGEINQVLLNLIVNASHAIADRVGESGVRGRISISTRVDGDLVLIAVADTGAGIDESIRDRIFDPFFTTKEVGRGTGQGLAIARAVVERHDGKLTFESRVGVGTTFFVRLPVRQASCAAAA